MKHKFRSQTPKIGFHTFTPQEASFYLKDYNGINRKLRRYLVDKYAESMRNHRFMLNAACISFDVNGQLIGGQHRLTGCAESDTPFLSGVMWGMPEEARSQDDAGAMKTLSDGAMVLGTTLTSREAQLCKNWYAYSTGWNSQNQTPREKLLDFMAEKRDSIRLVAELSRRRRGVCKVGFLVACAVLADKDKPLAEAFMSEIMDGVKSNGMGLIPTDPSFRLREYLSGSSGGGGMRVIEDTEKSFFAIHAWLNQLSCPKLGRKTTLIA